MRNRHRRRSNLRFAIGFGTVLVGLFRSNPGLQKTPTHGKPGKPTSERQVALLQNREGASASTHKQNVRSVLNWRASGLGFHQPAACRAAMHSLNMHLVFDLYTQ